MMLGISSYAYAWRRHHEREAPLSLGDVLQDAHRLGLGLVQLCDVGELERCERSRLRDLRRLADQLDLVLETGTKGIEPDHLARQLDNALLLGSVMIRSMLASTRARPSVEESVRCLRLSMPSFERHGVVLGLETYEQYPTADLVRVVREVGSPNLGICLDPGNSVAALEHPRDVVCAAAPYVVNVHVKDFAFTRSESMIGFRLAGARLGEGLLDFEHMERCLATAGVEVNHILEHWMTRTGTVEETARAEAEWVENSLRWLRARRRQTPSGDQPTP